MDAVFVSEYFFKESAPINDDELAFPLTLPEEPNQPDTRDPITRAQSFSATFAQTAINANHQEVDGKMSPQTSKKIQEIAQACMMTCSLIIYYERLKLGQ